MFTLILTLYIVYVHESNHLLYPINMYNFVSVFKIDISEYETIAQTPARTGSVKVPPLGTSPWEPTKIK